ncbi:LPS export ABC transporter periplasmic protein LptC [Pseudotamlana carrageenivorans]|uniref:LPS export ABC transporter periplasmic protein LptC n=1 Tax=Pseudotamlana carrageenivorans TaxID=2069432 RepID=A0A2I7SF57_9FLAO|nr:LPS export ABC transporter periplasmic protein LptC [Tamlana carrageenivorans]AUS04539.1 LPS export ABC transporter periplasmic protein LptC [Tamlana carrageenivorans]
MKPLISNKILNIVTVFTVAMFFSCQDNFKEVQKIGISENEPIGVDYNLNLKYTDSGRVAANLISTKTLDYSNRDFPFNEFVDGVQLDIFHEENRKSTVVADYAIRYTETELIDMQGNVVITTHDNRVLKTDQLYYDQKNEWLYTNEHVSFKSEQDIINGHGFDSNAKFTNAEVLEVTGIITLEE